MPNNALSRADQSDEPSAGWYENAVLAYGPRKAGTTLLQNLLDSDKDIFVYPAELKLKYFVKRGLEYPGAAARYVRRTRIPDAAIPRFDKTKYRDLLDQLGRSSHQGLKVLVCRDLDNVMSSIAGRAAADLQWWCAKEVGGRTDRIARWWLNNFDNARVVMLFRDPRMIVRAVLNDRRRQGHQPSLSTIYYETTDPRRVMRLQSAFIDHPNVLPVAYEDLIEDTEAVMARIADFLSVPFHPGLTVPTIFGEPVIVATASKPSKDVFREQARWFDGLTWRERIAVAAFSAAAFFRRKYRFSYRACRRRMAARIAREAG